MIETLLRKGHAYVAEDAVYFDVASWADYGKLSNRRLEAQETGTRALKGSGKRSPEDFALWIFAPEEHILQWNSPWGRGYPGWHIECSAMSRKYLGETFDIHGGGIDNIFPHNECEIAQSEAANGVPFARYWLLVGSLTVNGQKMSKSLGNFVTIKDALARYRPEVIRTFIFQSHYTNPIDFSDEAMRAAERGWERLASAVRLVRNRLRSAPENGENTFVEPIQTCRQEFIAAMDDDFNAPTALAALQTFTGEVNKLLNSGEPVNKATLTAIEALYDELGGQVMGILPKGEEQGISLRLTDGLIRLLIEVRQQARAEKNFARADQIRDQLKELGVILEDRPEGTTYRLE